MVDVGGVLDDGFVLDDGLWGGSRYFNVNDLWFGCWSWSGNWGDHWSGNWGDHWSGLFKEEWVEGWADSCTLGVVAVVANVSAFVIDVLDDCSCNSDILLRNLDEVDSGVLTLDCAVPLLSQENSSALSPVLNDVYISHNWHPDGVDLRDADRAFVGLHDLFDEHSVHLWNGNSSFVSWVVLAKVDKS